MDAVVEFIAEIFFEALAEVFMEIYNKLMSLFARDCKKIKKEKLQTFLVIELFVLIALFLCGLALRENSVWPSWTIILGKGMFAVSLAVPALQISLGLILTIIKKIRKKNEKNKNRV